MPEFFNKTGHGITDIISWDEFKPVFDPDFFGGIMVHISTVCLGGTEGRPLWLEPVLKKTFKSLK